MTLEEYLQQQGNQWRDRIDYGEDGGVAGAGWGRYVENDGGISWQYVDDETLGYLQSNPSIYNPAPQTAQPTIEQPVVAQPQAPQPVALPTPRSLEEYLQQQGFNEYRKGTMGYGADMTDEITQKAGWGRTMSPIETDGGVDRYFQYAPPEVIDAYFNNPSNFINARETPVGQGINTFNEGNADQKKVIDQINTGQLRIVPATAPDDLGRLTNDSFKVVDSRTGQTVNQQVIAIDKDKGVFSILADDPNSSGFFRNYVSTDPSGFVNPIVSEEQSQYNSRANNSLNFIKDSIKGIGMMALMASGAGAFTPELAAAEIGSSGLTAAEAANLANSSAFADSAMAGAEGLTQGSGLGAFTSAIPDYPMTVTPSDPLGSFQIGQGTSLSADAANNPLNPFYNVANPEVSANYNTVSNLVGGGAESNLASLNQLASNPLLPIGSAGIGGTELGSVGSILGTGQGLGQQTLAQVLAPTGLSGLSVQDLASTKPMYSTTPNLSDVLKAANTAKNVVKALTPAEQALKTAQTTQQQSNLANMLRGAQLPQTALPPIYHQANPFNFGQQALPVQDVSALAKLLRTA